MKKTVAVLLAISMFVTLLNGCSSKKTDESADKIQTVRDTIDESTRLPTQPEETKVTLETIEYADKTINLSHSKEQVEKLLDYISDLIEGNIKGAFNEYLTQNNRTITYDLFSNNKVIGEETLNDVRISKIEGDVTVYYDEIVPADTSKPRNGMYFYFTYHVSLEGKDSNGEIKECSVPYLTGSVEHYGIVLTPTDKEDGTFQRYDILIADEDQYDFFWPKQDFINEVVTRRGEWYDEVKAREDEHLKKLYPDKKYLVMLNEMEKEYTYE